MSLNVRSGEGQLPTFVTVPARITAALVMISAGVGTAHNTSVSVANVPGVALAKFNAVAQNNYVVEVLNVPGRALATLIADPNFNTGVTATRPALTIAGTGRVHPVVAVNTPNAPPVWSAVPTITFIQGTASNRDISTYVSDPNGDPLTITKTSGVLPTGVTYNQTLKRYEYNGVGAVAGTNGHVLTADDASGWDVLSTSPGVFYPVKLDNQADVDAHKGIGASHALGFDPRLPVFDSSVAPPGFAGSMRIDVMPSDAAASGEAQFTFPSNSFTTGQTVYVQFLFRKSRSLCYQPSGIQGTSDSEKIVIFSHSVASHTAFEVVIQQNNGSRTFGTYYEQGGPTVPDDVPYSSAYSSSDFRSHPSVDRGVARLTGVNPNSGVAWTTYEQQRARYGPLYSARQGGAPPNGVVGFSSGFPYANGPGDPLTGGISIEPDQWYVVLLKLVIGSPFTANTQRTIWIAPFGSAYQKLCDDTNLALGSDGRVGGNGVLFNTVWTLPYASNRDPGTGTNVSSRSGQLASAISIDASGLNCPVGAGQLEYNASTGALRFSASGQSYGAAQRFSTANGVTMLNLYSSGGGTSFIVVNLLNASALPSSGTTTETVTIGSGRAAGSVWYAGMIASTQPINTYGGFAPT